MHRLMSLTFRMETFMIKHCIALCFLLI